MGDTCHRHMTDYCIHLKDAIKLLIQRGRLHFYVHYDRAKCQEHIDENDIKIRLTIWILRAKWWKTHFLKSWVWTWYYHTVSRFLQPCHDFDGRMFSGPRHKNAPRFLKLWHDFGEPDPSHFTILRPFLFWIDLWCKHKSFR